MPGAPATLLTPKTARAAAAVRSAAVRLADGGPTASAVGSSEGVANDADVDRPGRSSVSKPSMQQNARQTPHPKRKKRRRRREIRNGRWPAVARVTGLVRREGDIESVCLPRQLARPTSATSGGVVLRRSNTCSSSTCKLYGNCTKVVTVNTAIRHHVKHPGTSTCKRRDPINLQGGPAETNELASEGRAVRS